MENNYEGEMVNPDEANEMEYQEELNQNNNKEYMNQNTGENEQEEELEEEDDRLTYTLITLGLGNLIHIFEDNNISFVDMLLLSKEDLIELQLEIFQRNRILNFSKLFTKYAKNYSIREISDFFTFNKQFIFNSSIYDKVFANNMNSYQTDFDDSNIGPETNNYEQYNQDSINFQNNNQNLNEMQNNNNNYINKTMKKNYNQNLNENNTDSLPTPQKVVGAPQKSQNLNGAVKKKKNVMNKNSNNNANNEINQDNFHNKLIDLIKKRKNTNQIVSQGNNGNSNIDRNEIYQTVLKKIAMMENNEMSYEIYTKFILIKNYLNKKGDKISTEDILGINNDIDTLIEAINSNKNENQNEMGLKTNEKKNIKNKIKVIKKQ